MSEPDGRIPEDAPRINDLNDLFQWTEDRVLQRMRDQLAPTQNHMREALRDGLLGSIADIFKGDSPRLPGMGFLRDAWVDGQEEIKDLWKRLSPLEEYASAYTDSGSGFYQGGKVRFDNLVVGSQGVTMVDGGMRLDDSGMWRIDSQIWVSYWIHTTTGIPDPLPRVSWELRVLRPDGSLYHRRLGDGFYGNSESALQLMTTVVTPEPGYTVELHVTRIVAGRDLFGGPERTHLTAHHINRTAADRPNV